jgi:ElaA protein
VIQWFCKPFDELGLSELYALLRLRQEVFSVEQNCGYLDADGADLNAHHVLGYQGGALLAYARILKPGSRYQQCSIGRVITASQIRRTGEGRKLMLVAIAHCVQLFPQADIRISAQARLEKFYQSFGFVTDGEPYEEDNIPHLAMNLLAPGSKVQSQLMPTY